MTVDAPWRRREQESGQEAQQQYQEVEVEVEGEVEEVEMTEAMPQGEDVEQAMPRAFQTVGLRKCCHLEQRLHDIQEECPEQELERTQGEAESWQSQQKRSNVAVAKPFPHAPWHQPRQAIPPPPAASAAAMMATDLGQASLPEDSA